VGDIAARAGHVDKRGIRDLGPALGTDDDLRRTVILRDRDPVSRSASSFSETGQSDAIAALSIAFDLCRYPHNKLESRLVLIFVQWALMR
jgi:hypothetical protein